MSVVKNAQQRDYTLWQSRRFCVHFKRTLSIAFTSITHLTFKTETKSVCYIKN